jgi:hypothetical protein
MRWIGVLIMLALGILLAGCKKQDDLVTRMTRGIEVGETRSNVADHLASREIEFEALPATENTSAFPRELIQKEAHDSPRIVFFISEPYGDTHTKTTRVIVVFNDQDLVTNVLLDVTYL